MVSNLKKQKGTTIVEVLVSVIIIGIVSVYGLSFFSSAYKHSVDSKDYNFVLHDLVRKMEMVKGSQYDGYPAASDNNYYPPNPNSPVNIPNNDQTIYDFKVEKTLREGCRVHYTCRVFVDEGTSLNYRFGTRIVCEATWPWATGETFSNAAGVLANKNKITLVTYTANRWKNAD